MVPEEVDELTALNAGVARNSDVRRGAKLQRALDEINRKLDELIARTGEVKQTKVK